MPTFLELDFAAGVLYFADSGSDCIRKIRLRDGEVTTVAGTGYAGFAEDGTVTVDAALNNPAGLAVTSQGLCFVDAAIAGFGCSVTMER